MNWQFSLPRLLRAPSHTLRQIEYVFEKEEVSWLTHVHEFNRVYFSLYYLIIVSIESTFRRFNCSLKKKKKRKLFADFLIALLELNHYFPRGEIRHGFFFDCGNCNRILLPPPPLIHGSTRRWTVGFRPIVSHNPRWVRLSRGGGGEGRGRERGVYTAGVGWLIFPVIRNAGLLSHRTYRTGRRAARRGEEGRSLD